MVTPLPQSMGIPPTNSYMHFETGSPQFPTLGAMQTLGQDFWPGYTYIEQHRHFSACLVICIKIIMTQLPLLQWEFSPICGRGRGLFLLMTWKPTRSIPTTASGWLASTSSLMQSSLRSCPQNQRRWTNILKAWWNNKAVVPEKWRPAENLTLAISLIVHWTEMCNSICIVNK